MTETLARSNRQLLEKASELEAIVESIADGVLVLDADDQIVTMNAAAQHLLADMAYDFASGPLRELTASLAADGGEEAAQNGSGAPEPAQQPRRYQIGNRILSALAAPVQTPQEEKVGTVVVLRDITREAEAEHLKDAFITSISHELRTPLTVIKVYADLMQSGANGELDERQRRFIQNINKGSQQLEHHINQLINLSEIQAGTINMDKERLDFGELVNNVADHWRERLEQKELSLTLDRPQESVWINADAGHLSWAIDNLLSNALNYTPAGGRVSLHVLAEQDNVRLLIADSGIGIATADQPHLFDRFFRAASEVNYTVHGVGLGLYISRAIVEMHGGHISVESESGVGSTFTIALPRNE
jgi:signal transduction histidine kinase